MGDEGVRAKGAVACNRILPSRREEKDPAEVEEELGEDEGGLGACEKWGNLPMELLVEMIRRVEGRDKAWPSRKQVLFCAQVCRSWRAATIQVVRTVEESGLITFPLSLKQPGPREFPVQCYIRRERASSTYYLYLGLTPALVTESSKFLLAARKIRRATSTDFIISLSPNDFSRASAMYVGKLRSNFLGIRFTIYDGQPIQDVSIPARSSSSRRIHCKQVSPRVSAGNYAIGSVSYEVTVLRSRGPRKMLCTLHSIPVSSTRDGGTAPTPMPTNISRDGDEPSHSMTSPVNKEGTVSGLCHKCSSSNSTFQPLALRNKTPRWHEQLQCWCLNFRGRVTVASVKNFQLVADTEPFDQFSPSEQETVILQFGKIGKDTFTMDYMYPISAFQAFAICLSSFDTKHVCE